MIELHEHKFWTARSAQLGGLLWVGIVLAAQGGRVPIGIIEQLLLLAPLVIVPLGFLLINRLYLREQRHFAHQLASRLQPFAALLVVASFWLMPGMLVASLTLPWFLVSGLAGFARLSDVRRRGLSRIEDVCLDAGSFYLVVGAAWLIVSRFGGHLLGFDEPIVLLTAVHFHYTGFALPLITAALGQALNRLSPRAYPLFRWIAIGVIGSPPLIAIGFVFSPLLQMIAVMWLTASVVGLSVLSFRVLPRLHHRLAKALVSISATSGLVGMAFVGVYAVGEFTGQWWLSISHMARTHGVINAVGLTLCGLLAWLMESPQP